MPISVVDLCARRTSVLLNTPETIIDSIVRHQWSGVYKALREKSSVEISGFGVFSLRNNIIEKRINKCDKLVDYYNKILETEENEKTQEIINSYLEDKQYLENKLRNGNIKDNRGMEKPSDTTEGSKGIDNTSESREVRDM